MLTPQIQMVPLADLVPHPGNPRLAPRADIVEALAQRMREHGFDALHMLLVRPLEDGYQIVSGHHRAMAAREAGLAEVPCCVREMSDDEAYMLLMLENTHGELTSLEEGIHALGSGLSTVEYTRKAGVNYKTFQDKLHAAKVFDAYLKPVSRGTLHAKDECSSFALHEKWLSLAVIYGAPAWLWRALVDGLLVDSWTVEATKRQVKALKEVEAPPLWADISTIANNIVSNDMNNTIVGQFASTVDTCLATLTRQKIDAARLTASLLAQLTAAKPSALSEVQSLCHAVEEMQAALLSEQRQQLLVAQQRQEQVQSRIARLRKSVSLEEWHTLAPDEQHALLHLDPSDVETLQFNKQESAAIEWAQWSYNPIVGCEHTCPYCYARDIAQNEKFAAAFPNGFAPTLRPSALLTPRHMRVPKEAGTDTRYRNVFTGSMADMFGRWVPTEWIEAVFAAMRLAPDWNFLCLTKFPKRLSEFVLPANGWFGTTVDLQARVKAAEDAFAQIKTGVRWLSIEPMLESLHFEHLEYFDWLVIGGASASTQTPAWRPPVQWIRDLERQAEEAGCKVYYKTNLLGKRRLELPFNAPIPDETEAAPDVFHYLGKGS